MKKLVSLLFMVLALLSATLIYAQDSIETQSIELPNGEIIIIEADWEFADQDGIYVFTRADAETIKLILPENLAPYYADDPIPPTAAELLLMLSAEEAIPHAISESDIEVSDFGAGYSYTEGSTSGEVQVLAWDDGFVYLEINAETNELSQLRLIATGMLIQLGYTAPELGATAGECFVSTDNPEGAPLRLGPGLYRAEFVRLMPDDGEVRTLAQHYATDGTYWWRVEEDYAVVNELWVNNADVTTSGNCASVPSDGITDPPFLTPDPNAPTPTVTPDPIPANGTWRWTPSSDMLWACEGTRTVHVPNPVPSFGGIITLTATPDGRSITVFDETGTYDFIGENNGFYTAYGYPFPDDMIGVLFLRVTSPTTMRMEIAIVLSDLPCSGAIPVSTTYIG